MDPIENQRLKLNAGTLFRCSFGSTSTDLQVFTLRKPKSRSVDPSEGRSGALTGHLPGRNLRKSRTVSLIETGKRCFTKDRNSSGSNSASPLKKKFKCSLNVAPEHVSEGRGVRSSPPESNGSIDVVYKISLICFIVCLLVNIFIAYGGEPAASVLCPQEARQIQLQDLMDTLLHRVYGQDSAIRSIIAHFEAYLHRHAEGTDVSPLVLSFHGSTGVGKTYAAAIIADHFSRSGSNVQWYFKLFGNLSNWLHKKIDACSFNLFVLDDVDRSAEDILIQLREFLHSSKTVDTLVFRNSKHPLNIAFVITTNGAANAINKMALEAFTSNASRLVAADDVESLMQEDEIQWFQSFVPNFKLVPFLPLDEGHVRLCVKEALERSSLNASDKSVMLVMKNVKYFPEHFPVFSKLGCKRIHL